MNLCLKGADSHVIFTLDIQCRWTKNENQQRFVSTRQVFGTSLLETDTPEDGNDDVECRHVSCLHDCSTWKPRATMRSHQQLLFIPSAPFWFQFR